MGKKSEQVKRMERPRELWGHKVDQIRKRREKFKETKAFYKTLCRNKDNL